MKKKILAITILALAICMAIAFVKPVMAEDISNELPQGNDSTITLTEDVTLTKEFEVKEGTTVTIDLNGFTITAAKGHSAIWNKGGDVIIKDSDGNGFIIANNTENSNVPLIQNTKGTLTITGGTITSKENTNGGAAVYNEKDGILKVSGGTIIAGTHGADVATGTWGIVNLGTATISGGSFVQNYEFSVIQNTGKMTITGGDFRTSGTGTHYELITNQDSNDNSAELDIKGGNYTSEKVIFNDETGNVTISKGTFSNPESIKEYLVDGYTFDENGNVVTVESLTPNDEQPNEPADKPADEPDDTPKTGSVDVALITSVVAMISVAGIVAVKRYSK